MTTRVEIPSGSDTPVLPPQGDDGRPAWLPEKFKSPEDLAKAYSALEARLGGPKPPEASQPGAPAAPPPDADAAAKAVADAGLNIDEFTAEFEKDGGLSEGSYDKLAKVGIPKDVVDAYIAGQSVVGQNLVTEALAGVGGEEAFAEMAAWAANALPETTLSRYNALVGSGDPVQMKAGLALLKSSYEGAVGSSGRTVDAGGRANGGGFESWEQVRAAMSDPRYKADSAYRSQIERKLAASSL